ncbi:MAG: hypothetical protein M3P23_05530 [Actinomycetota bacterium]|nr:hypothetical protein [Actinomycetota bacterium]
MTAPAVARSAIAERVLCAVATALDGDDGRLTCAFEDLAATCDLADLDNAALADADLTRAQVFAHRDSALAVVVALIGLGP